jgi:uncharacterized protein (TIGR02996 family)
MPDHEGFLRAIREAPDDDGPRLVYADWLDEHGEPDRAALIRVQCELFRLPPDDPRRPVLEARLRELLDRNLEAWVAPLRGLGADSSRYTHGWFRRGFVEEVEMEATRFLTSAPALFAAAPVLSGLCLQYVREHLPSLGACPWLGRVSRLKFMPEPAGMWALRHAELEDAALEAFFASPHLYRVADLDLSFHLVHLGGVRALAGAASLKALQDLNLCSCIDVRAAGAAALASSPNLACLERLDLGDSATWPEPPGNAVGDEGAAALASSPHLGNLRKLSLSFSRIGDAGALFLAFGSLARLADLDLGNNQLGEEGLRALVGATGLPALAALGLANNPAGPRDEYYYDDYNTLAGGNFDREKAAEIAARFPRPVRIY